MIDPNLQRIETLPLARTLEFRAIFSSSRRRGLHAVAANGMPVFALKGMSDEEFWWAIDQTMKPRWLAA